MAAWLQLRYPLGPLVARVNHALRNAVASFHPDVVWFDKPVLFTRGTMRAIRETGAKIVFYVQDAPFGKRNGKLFSSLLKNAPTKPGSTWTAPTFARRLLPVLANAPSAADTTTIRSSLAS